MTTTKNKFMQVLSNGSLIFCHDTFTSSQQCQINEKDYKNFFLFKKNRIVTHKKFNSLLRYKNQYLF